MKKLFAKKNNAAVTEDPFATAKASVKKTLILNKIALGINATTLIATPAAITMITSKIDDDDAKKALYITGGLLWVYQLSDTINAAKAVKFAKAAYGGIEDFANDFITEDDAEVNEDLEELEELING